MKNTMGSWIAARRKAKGMSQENLAERLGVSSQAVSKWENDVSCPSINLLPHLAKLLGVTVDELLTGQTEEERSIPENGNRSFGELTLRVSFNSGDGDKVRVMIGKIMEIESPDGDTVEVHVE